MSIAAQAIVFFGFDLGKSLPDELEEIVNNGEVGDKYSVINEHCYADSSCYYVALKDTVQSCWYGNCRDLKLDHLSDGDINKLFTFCQKYNIPWQEPKWRLVAYLC